VNDVPTSPLETILLTVVTGLALLLVGFMVGLRCGESGTIQVGDRADLNASRLIRAEERRLAKQTSQVDALFDEAKRRMSEATKLQKLGEQRKADLLGGRAKGDDG